MTARANTTPPPLYVPMPQAQAVFGLHRTTFYRAADKGEIRIYHAGRTALLKTEEVHSWLAGRNPSETK
jgi:excisionase family DNA binding protein